MALREAGIVESRRDGRNIFYRIKNLKILDLIQAAGQFNAKDSGAFQIAAPEVFLGDCPCPKCEADSPENPSVKNSRTVWIEDIQHD